MKPLAEVTPDEADAWWDELDRRTTDAEDLAKARLLAAWRDSKSLSLAISLARLRPRGSSNLSMPPPSFRLLG